MTRLYKYGNHLTLAPAEGGHQAAFFEASFRALAVALGVFSLGMPATNASSGRRENETFEQPGPTSTEKIGEWYEEAEFFDDSVDPSCPAGELCRYEDLVLGLYDADIGSLGHPAETTDCPGGGSSGALTLSDDSTKTVVNAFDLSGEVRKVGRSTGCTQGEKIATCQTVPVGLGGETRYFLCIAEVEDVGFTGGDSGSPVFTWTTSEASIGGVAFAATNGGGNYFYAEWSQIEDVYGDIDVKH